MAVAGAILGSMIGRMTSWRLHRTLSFDEVETMIVESLKSEVEDQTDPRLNAVWKGINLALLKLGQMGEIRADIEVNGEHIDKDVEETESLAGYADIISKTSQTP